MKPIKVCIIAKYAFPQDTRLSQQVKTLDDFGIATDCICGNTGYEQKEEQLKSVTVHRVFKKAATKQSFLIYLLATFNFIMSALFKLLSLSLKNNYKVIVVHTLPEFLVFTTVFNKLSGSAVILDGRDLTVDLLTSRWPGKKITPIKMVAVFIERCVTSLCDEIITASNGFKRSLVTRGVPEEKIKVMVNTADETIFQFDKERVFNPITEQARLIYHGTVAERFGLIVAVEAMKKVSKEIPGSTLHIFGFFNPGYRKKIEDCISELKLEENVRLYDPLNLGEIYKQILTMDLGVVPYLSDNFMNLALSTKTFEYIASGLPVIASRLKSSEELFDDSCVQYSHPGDPDDLADKIVKLCCEPTLRASKRDNAFNTFDKYYTSSSQSLMYTNMLAPYLGIEKIALADAYR